MSSPLNRMRPAVTSYSGLPSRALASVDLPEPLGPISAWTSPAPTVRSTPFRISAPPARDVEILDLEQRGGGHGFSVFALSARRRNPRFMGRRPGDGGGIAVPATSGR